MIACQLCSSTKVEKKLGFDSRTYFFCISCYLIFLDPDLRLSEEFERKCYSNHQNMDNEGYRSYLQKIWAPLSSMVKKESSVIDFGCGPGPVLAKMIGEAGHEVVLYDKYFYPDSEVLNDTYDVVVSTEVVEHFRDPLVGFEQLDFLLKKSAIIAIMTSYHDEVTDFKNWYYLKDLTHICFYHSKTFELLAAKFNWEIIRNSRNLFIARKN